MRVGFGFEASRFSGVGFWVFAEPRADCIFCCVYYYFFFILFFLGGGGGARWLRSWGMG